MVVTIMGYGLQRYLSLPIHPSFRSARLPLDRPSEFPTSAVLHRLHWRTAQTRHDCWERREQGRGKKSLGLSFMSASLVMAPASDSTTPEKTKGPEAFSATALRILFKPISNSAQPIQPISEAARFLPASAVGQKSVC